MTTNSKCQGVRWWWSALALLLAALAIPALAGITTTPVTVTGTSGACLGQVPGQQVGQLSPTAQFLVVKNESKTDTIAFSLGYTALPTAALNTAGNITLLPGQEQVLVTGLLAGSYLACVSGGTSTPVTVVVY